MTHINAWILALLCSLVGAGYAIAGKLLASDINPISLTFLRILIASLCFLPCVNFKTYFMLSWRDLAILAVAGISGIFCTNVLYFKSLESISALNASLINSLVPLCILIINSVYYKKIPKRSTFASYLLGLCGVLLMTTQGGIAPASGNNISGTLLMVLSVFCWIIYSICAQLRSEKLSAEAFTLGTCIIGLIPLAPLGMYCGAFTLIQELSQRDLFLIGYISIFATGFGYYLYALTIQRMGADKASFITYSSAPLCVLILMHLIFNVPITLWDLIGSTCIIASLILHARAT